MEEPKSRTSFTFSSISTTEVCSASLSRINNTLDEKLAARITEQILKGLIEMHRKGYIHRDLKPDNIILHFECMDPNQPVSEDFLKDWDFMKHNCFSVVIADLGISREVSLIMTLDQGTPLYRAPEVGEKTIYGVKADILSLGIILYELLFGDPLFTKERACNLKGLKKLWTQTDEYYSSKTSERKISFEAMQFLQYCLQKDPDNRLQADELYELDFIRNAYNDEKYSYPSARSDTKLYLTRHNYFDMEE